MTKKRQKAFRRGRNAEFIARLLLILKGYRIIAYRYKSKFGEIDCIARKGDRLIFVEVKYRTNINAALEAINSSQQKRIGRAALDFVSHQRLRDPLMRFDAIVIVPWGMPRHIKNAWQPLP